MKNRTKASTRKIATAKKPVAKKATVRNTAKVTVKQTVNGTTPTKKVSSGPRRGSRSSNVVDSSFPKKLLLEAQSVLRPGEKLVVLSSTSAKTVYVEK